MRLIVKSILFGCCILICLAEANAQSSVPFNFTTYGLESDAHNIIQNEGHLEDFFESLYQQKTADNRKINIVHIGDSHVQGDFLTAIVRRNFQHNFGNAGRGFVFPARLAATNEPWNILSKSSAKWDVKRCVTPDLPLPIGLSGITISNNKPGADIMLVMKDPVMNYRFSEVTLFYQKDVSSFDFIIKDTLDQPLATIGSATDSPFLNYSTVKLNEPLSSFKLEAVQHDPDQDHATIFGFSLLNGKNGVAYHAIGVNGARYEHYNASLYFAKQTAALSPDLFIISLGTNEAINYPYLDKNFSQQIDKLVTALQTANPSAQFIFVTPPDAFRKKIQKNPGVRKIREQIIHYAVENGYAFYDMYMALGGDQSASEWKKAGLLRSDGIHFTRQGYEYQANLFFSAFMKSYNKYVPLRHP